MGELAPSGRCLGLVVEVVHLEFDLDGFEKTPRPLSDPARLHAVAETRLLDTGREETFDRLSRLAGAVLKVPYAFVTIVDEQRSFWKSCFGVASDDVSERQNSVEESFCQYVVNSDAPVFVTDSRLDELTSHNPSVSKMNVIAWAGYPLRSIDGHVLGTFCVVDHVAREWTDAERDVLHAVAGAVESEIRLRTLLEHSADVAEGLRREMELRQNLASLALSLAANRTGDEVSRSIMEFCPGLLGAHFAVLAIVDDHRRSFRISVPDSLDAVVAEKYASVPMLAATPLGDAMRTRTAVFLRDRADHVPRYEHLLSDGAATGVVAVCALPLFRADGSVVAGLGVSWTSAQVFDPTIRALLSTIGSMAGQAIERAQLADRRDQLVSSMQHQLLASFPTIASVDFSVHYLPATHGLGFGGDWFDVIDLPDGRAAFVVGDVTGHGIEAAVTMTHVRSVMNALTRMHADDLSGVFDAAEAVIDTTVIATVAIAVIDPRRDTIATVSAGHPPFIVLSAGGSSEIVAGGRRSLLGVGASRPVVQCNAFPTGSVLVGYTDGLVERRDEAIDVGIDRVVEVVRTDIIQRSPVCRPGYAESVVERVMGGLALMDDVALIVVRRNEFESTVGDGLNVAAPG